MNEGRMKDQEKMQTDANGRIAGWHSWPRSLISFSLLATFPSSSANFPVLFYRIANF